MKARPFEENPVRRLCGCPSTPPRGCANDFDSHDSEKFRLRAKRHVFSMNLSQSWRFRQVQPPPIDESIPVRVDTGGRELTFRGTLSNPAQKLQPPTFSLTASRLCHLGSLRRTS
jgi:hypothetical protein